MKITNNILKAIPNKITKLNYLGRLCLKNILDLTKLESPIKKSYNNKACYQSNKTIKFRANKPQTPKFSKTLTRLAIRPARI